MVGSSAYWLVPKDNGTYNLVKKSDSNEEKVLRKKVDPKGKLGKFLETDEAKEHNHSDGSYLLSHIEKPLKTKIWDEIEKRGIPQD